MKIQFNSFTSLHSTPDVPLIIFIASLSLFKSSYQNSGRRIQKYSKRNRTHHKAIEDPVPIQSSVEAGDKEKIFLK